MACVPTLSTYLINALLKHLTSQVTYTPPATLYLALYTTNPNPNNSGTEVTTSGTAYSRQPITWGTIGALQQASNSTIIPFPLALANYGIVSFLAIMDASTGGNLLAFTPVTTPQTVNTGSMYQVNIGDLVWSFQ